jgi:drug/metabolite transporter (DMT)-like permease
MLIWGGAWPVGKLLSVYGSVTDVVATRFIIVVISMLPFMWWYKIPFHISKAGWWHLFVAGILMAVYSLLFLKGLKHGFPGAGGVLVTTLNPIFAYTIGMALQKKLPSKSEFLGLSLGIIGGIIQLQLWGKFSQILESGNIYFLTASFTWAVMSKFSSKAAGYGNPIAFSFWMYFITVIFLLFFVDINSFKSLVREADINFWTLMLYAGTIGTSLATSIYLLATSKLGAEKASSFIFIVPVSAALTSWFFLGETIHLHTIIGGILGIGAVYILNKK